MPASFRSSRPENRRQSGIALLMTLLVFLILAAVVYELTSRSTIDYLVAKNDAEAAKMELAIESVLLDTYDTLRSDAEADSASASPEAASLPSSDSGAEGSAPTGPSDSREDEWARPIEATLGDVRVTVTLEDENRKFNLLTLLSPHEEFQKESLERLIRLLDRFREDTDFDLDSSAAETLATSLLNYMKGVQRRIEVPRPSLASDASASEKDKVFSPFLTLDELLLVEGFTEELMYDRRDERDAEIVIPGLNSVLTVWSALQSPQEQSSAAGSSPPPPETPQAPTAAAASTGSSPVGIKININTASRPVLRSLLSEQEFPPDVIEAIIRYRNLEKEEEEEDSSFDSPAFELNELYGEDVVPREFYASLGDLDKVVEYKNFSDPNAKAKLQSLVGVQSDVFSIYLTATLLKDDGGEGLDTETGEEAEEDTGKIVHRVRSVVWRRQGANGTEIVPILRWEVRRDKKYEIRDFKKEDMPIR